MYSEHHDMPKVSHDTHTRSVEVSADDSDWSWISCTTILCSCIPIIAFRDPVSVQCQQASSFATLAYPSAHSMGHVRNSSGFIPFRARPPYPRIEDSGKQGHNSALFLFHRLGQAPRRKRVFSLAADLKPGQN